MGVPTFDSRPAGSHVDMFLSVKGAAKGQIKGEAQDAQHKNEIEVSGWSWGMEQAPSLGGTTARGRATMRELEIRKRVDAASTALMGALRHNELIKEAVLTVRKAGDQPLEFLKITVEDGRVASISIEIQESTGTTTLYEKVTFAYNKIKVEYTTQGKAGGGTGTSTFEDVWTTQA